MGSEAGPSRFNVLDAVSMPGFWRVFSPTSSFSLVTLPHRRSLQSLRVPRMTPHCDLSSCRTVILVVGVEKRSFSPVITFVGAHLQT